MSYPSIQKVLSKCRVNQSHPQGAHPGPGAADSNNRGRVLADGRVWALPSLLQTSPAQQHYGSPAGKWVGLRGSELRGSRGYHSNGHL